MIDGPRRCCTIQSNDFDSKNSCTESTKIVDPIVDTNSTPNRCIIAATLSRCIENVNSMFTSGMINPSAVNLFRHMDPTEDCTPVVHHHVVAELCTETGS